LNSNRFRPKTEQKIAHIVTPDLIPKGDRRDVSIASAFSENRTNRNLVLLNGLIYKLKREISNESTP